MEFPEILRTERLILRPFCDADAQALYDYAKDPRIGPPAGWQPHTSVENSLDIIHTVLSAAGTYAVTLAQTGQLVGSVGFHAPCTDQCLPNELEVGFCLAISHWGQGLIPEATRAITDFYFTSSDNDRLWCAYYEGNAKSARAQEKCGFVYHHTEADKPCALMGDIRTEIFQVLTREAWLTQKQQA